MCPVEAAIPIKCYSPEIIVHPNKNNEDIKEWLGFAGVFVCGPGMGRSIQAETTFNELLAILEI